MSERLLHTVDVVCYPLRGQFRNEVLFGGETRVDGALHEPGKWVIVSSLAAR